MENFLMLNLLFLTIKSILIVILIIIGELQKKLMQLISILLINWELNLKAEKLYNNILDYQNQVKWLVKKLINLPTIMLFKIGKGLKEDLKDLWILDNQSNLKKTLKNKVVLHWSIHQYKHKTLLLLIKLVL